MRWLLPLLLALCACNYFHTPLDGPDARSERPVLDVQPRDATEPCSLGSVRCGETCVDLTSNAQHCGVCNRACELGQCREGQCECERGASICGGVCVDTQRDTQHCGSCSTRCAAGQSCEQGRCVVRPCPEGEGACNDRCTPVDSALEHCGVCRHRCPAFHRCEFGICTLGNCPPGHTLCGRQCLDLRTDPTNCGACEHRCGPEGRCENGVCVGVRCPTGLSICNDQCVSLSNDRNNCGSCGHVCTACPNALGSMCFGGSCLSLAGCGPGRANCSTSDPCNPICADLSSDRSNCGACGFACSTNQMCVNGGCVPLVCSNNTTNCSGACVDLTSNQAHCGRCGQACASTETCVAGQCTLVPCSNGYQRCNGACRNVNIDIEHCGACGQRCDTATCMNGTCRPTECMAPLSPCGRQCVDLRTSATHCGACNAACAAPSICFGGECVAPATMRYGVRPSARTWFATCEAPGAMSYSLQTQQNTAPFSLPFPFSLFGMRVTRVVADQAARLHFAEPSLTTVSTSLPTGSDPRPGIFAFTGEALWFARGGRVCIAIDDSRSHRSVVVEYRDVELGRYSYPSFSFQIALESETNNVHILYGAVPNEQVIGLSMVVGLQDTTGTVASVFASPAAPGIYSGLALRFYPRP